MNRNKIALVFATWFGSGLLPPVFVTGMAGTYGSLASLPLCWWLVSRCWDDLAGGLVLYLITGGVVTAMATWSIPIAEIALGPRKDWKGKTRTRDQNQIVIDETIGMLVACLPIAVIGCSHLAFLPFAAALFSFRVFDTVKPWPANRFDQMKNRWGVILDDVSAAIWAAPIVALVDYFLL